MLLIFIAYLHHTSLYYVVREHVTENISFKICCHTKFCITLFTNKIYTSPADVMEVSYIIIFTMDECVLFRTFEYNQKQKQSCVEPLCRLLSYRFGGLGFEPCHESYKLCTVG